MNPLPWGCKALLLPCMAVPLCLAPGVSSTVVTMPGGPEAEVFWGMP